VSPAHEPGLELRVEDHLAWLVLDSPPRNETSHGFFQTLRRLAREVLPGLDVLGLIVHGRGRHFSSGADVVELRRLLLSSGPGRVPDFLAENVDTLLAMERLPFPVVAAVHGACYGSGLELALCCHYRVATPRAVFSLPEVSFGLMPGCGGSVRLPRLVGRARALELILSGRSLLADEARALGLVDLLAERHELLAVARRWIHALWRTCGEAGWQAGPWVRGRP
jgi:enoyl-CoA hydratase/carnithine racemase